MENECTKYSIKKLDNSRDVVIELSSDMGNISAVMDLDLFVEFSFSVQAFELCTVNQKDVLKRTRMN